MNNNQRNASYDLHDAAKIYLDLQGGFYLQGIPKKSFPLLDKNDSRNI